MTGRRANDVSEVEVNDVDGVTDKPDETMAVVDGEDRSTPDATSADEPSSDQALADQTPPDETPPNAEPKPRSKRWLVPIALAVLLLASAGMASWAYLTQFRPDQQTDAAVAADTVKAASDGSLALLTYSPATLDQDFANAKSHLTGEFLSYYTQFTQDIVTPAAKEKAVTTTATIVHAAVSELNPGSATVLVFLNQTTMSKENPGGSFTASSVKVGMTKVNGTWLISAFDPV